MRKFFVATTALAAIAFAGTALAQPEQAPGHHGRGGMLFQSDSNNDGVVTRAEFDASRAATFARLDTNTDGALTREEQRAGWQALRAQRGERRGGHFGRADANSDGNITREEFLARPIAHFERLDANDDGVLSADERPQRREGRRGDRAGWTNPDADNNGSLSRAEYEAAGAARFERLDANHDGGVTREEAEAARPRRNAG